MSVSLAKGGSVSLTKEAGSSQLTSVTVGLGWDPRDGFGAVFDLDASAIVLGASGKALSDSEFVFYNNTRNPSGAVVYGGDNRTGEGDGDDETIAINLPLLPAEAQSVVFLVSIDMGIERGQSFGVVDNAFIRVVNNSDGRELARFDLTDGATSDVALSFGELFRDGGDWKFQAIGDGYSGGLVAALANYGINAG